MDISPAQQQKTSLSSCGANSSGSSSNVNKSETGTSGAAIDCLIRRRVLFHYHMGSLHGLAVVLCMIVCMYVCVLTGFISGRPPILRDGGRR